MSTYSVILADPPWRYRVHSGQKGKRTAESFYPTMATADIAVLPVSPLAAENCALFLWVTAPLLADGLQVITGWGFRYKTIAFTWIKTNARSGSIFTGMGHYTRGNAELCLLGIKGRMPVSDRSVSQVIHSPRREHSRKPDEIYGLIERLYPGQGYLELFARHRRSGWDCWGNEVKSDLAVGGVA